MLPCQKYKVGVNGLFYIVKMSAGMRTHQEEHISKQPDYWFWILLLMYIEHFHSASSSVLR